MEKIEISNYDKSFGAYLVINTSECESWAVSDKPLIHSVTSIKEFIELGFDVDASGKPFTGLKVGEKACNFYYEGVYVMRVA